MTTDDHGTDLDRAFEGSEADDAARLRFYAALADAELFILLEREPEGDDIAPRLFPVEGTEVVLAFDTQERLAEFAQGVVPYVALPGRILAQLLAEAGLGLGVNLDVAPSATLLPSEALAWLVETLAQTDPGTLEARLTEVLPPRGVPEVLLMGLAERLHRAGGLAQAALLAEVRYEGGGTGHLLALVGAEPRAHPALARAASEALTFSGIDAGFLDVAFLDADAPLAARLQSVAYAFELPQPQAPQDVQIPGAAPGMDPGKPPRLH